MQFLTPSNSHKYTDTQRHTVIDTARHIVTVIDTQSQTETQS